MKRIDWSRVTVLLITGAVWLLYVGILVLLPAQHHHRTPDLVTSEAWHQIAIRQQVRASVAEMYLRRCQDEPMTPIKCPSDQTDGELQSRAHIGEPQGIDPMRGNPSSSALAAGRSVSNDTPADGPKREPVTADTKGQPSNDEASIALYRSPSDRAKEEMWQSNINARASNAVASATVRPAGRVLTVGTAHVITEIRSDLPVRGKGEAWNRTVPAHGPWVYARLRAEDALRPATSAIAVEMATTGSPLPSQSPVPCRLPIAIRTDGKLAEPCEPTVSAEGVSKWTTSQSTTAPALTPTVSAITTSPLRAQSAAIVSSVSTSSLHRPSAPPEAPVTCASDALGGVTTYWNAISVDWFRKSQSNPPGKRLPWLFQCRGDLAEKLTAAAQAARSDPDYTADPSGWMVGWLYDHGVYMRDVYAWHHFTVVRPQEAAGVTEVTIQFDVWESRGEVDRDGMNGEVLADPDCTDECRVYFWAPMVPGTASVVKWGGR